ncbi:MAG: histone deacetylase [Candidatus Dadabacteria bacterium]|nr:histone deacetylase [Candidatus Dadabacteria bacterium]
MKKVGIVLDKLYVDHNNGPGHPECPERLLVMIDALKENDLLDKLVRIEPRDATEKEITLVHQPIHYRRMKATKGKPRVFLDSDTSTCPISFDAALRAAGGMVTAVDAVMAGDIDIGFPLVRPPGHHAETDRAMGFCLFNNVAVGAAHAVKNHDLDRILIVDWDLHHGNGTEHMFNNRRDILYFSTHQHPYYPGTGAFTDVGFDRGAGYTINVPLTPIMGDAEYMKIFNEILTPVIEQYEPEMILVSVGFDTYENDPLGGMNVTPSGFAQQTRFLKEKAQQYCDGRIVYVLEGGYDLDGLWLSTKSVFEELLELNTTDYGDLDAETKADGIIGRVEKTLSDYWKF